MATFLRPARLCDVATTTLGTSPTVRRVEVASGVSCDVDTLYRQHRDGLLRLAFLLVGDAATAEDVVQDVFVGLHQRWSTLRDPALGLTYARSAVLNRSRSVLRRRVTARRHMIREGEPAWSAESVVLLGEQRREVLVALSRIAPRQREVLVLRYWLELSEREIADALAISVGSVKSAASRGLDALERRLGGPQ